MSGQAYGQQGFSDANSLAQLILFLIDQRLGHARTGTPVKVMAVHGGGVGPAPTVDVQPVVKQSDGIGTTISHGTIYGIPCKRNQGGGNAFINDPKVGDIGYLAVADRDISSVVSNGGAESNPGSFRRHDLADGVYQGAMLNQATPDQYFIWTDSGFKISDKNGNTIVGGPNGVVINGVVISQGGTISNATDLLNTAQTSFTTHIHGSPPIPTPGS